MKLLYKILSLIIIAPILILVFNIGAVSLIEGYNVFSPYIDTEFAENYTPEKFDLIQMDLNKEDVLKILGEPLQKNTWKNETVFHYTLDAFLSRRSDYKYLIRDFAWYRSNIYFNTDGEITKIDKGWTYN
jgi:outer membrane protein assembly factor BamE (lipoprotein component of BamABCDE complex)